MIDDCIVPVYSNEPIPVPVLTTETDCTFLSPFLPENPNPPDNTFPYMVYDGSWLYDGRGRY